MKHILGIYISGKLWRKIHLDDYPDFRKGQTITLGRRETCDICIPQGTISREHAHIKNDGKNIRIIDNGSLNGIYLAGRKRSQIVLENGMPFASRIPYAAPVAIGGMTKMQMDAELMKGVESLKSGKSYTAEDIDAQFAEEFGE